MSNFFTSSSSFSQATYSPLRSAQDNNYDDDPSSTSPSLKRGSPRQFRHRSHSRSSSRSIHMSDPHQLQQMSSPAAFSDDEEDDTDSDDPGHAQPPSIIAALPTDAIERASRRSNVRPQSMSGSTTVVLVNDGGIPISPPPKYTSEDMEYSDPSHPRGRDEELGLGPDHHGKGDGLLMQVCNEAFLGFYFTSAHG